jgi:hypothetical protein
MKIVLYKLYDTARGKFNAGGDHWTSKGKCWNQRNHLTTKFTQEVKFQLEMLWRSKHEISYDEYYRRAHSEFNKSAEYKNFIPETWVVIEITNDGVRELCKAQDWLSQT